MSNFNMINNTVKKITLIKICNLNILEKAVSQIQWSKYENKRKIKNIQSKKTNIGIDRLNQNNCL